MYIVSTGVHSLLSRDDSAAYLDGVFLESREAGTDPQVVQQPPPPP